MRQKLQHFKKQIRTNQINSYFAVQRTQQAKLAFNKQITFVIQEEARNRRAVFSEIQAESPLEEHLTDCSFQEKCSAYQTQLKFFHQKSQYGDFLMILKQINHELKKITKMQKTQTKRQAENLVNTFLSKNILSVVVDAVLKASEQKIGAGILQQLSKRAISILNYSIQLSPDSFREQLFINSNILLFLRCCINQPKFDQDHLTKIIIIIIHMIIVSVNETSQLFYILNSKDSKFTFSAIFFNLTRIQLNPGLNITQNFIIFMKHYLYKIEEDFLKDKKFNKQAKSTCCLESSSIEMINQVANLSVNALIYVDFYDEQAVDALEEALEVSRILIQYFSMCEKNKIRLDFRGLIKIFYYKDCRMQVKSKILTIIDHIIYEEEVNELTEFLVRECELIPALWLLRDDFYRYTMNIFCNLILNKDIKPFLNSYIHQIFSYFKHSKGDKLLWMFVYNWFSSQGFEIIQSRDKLIVELMKDSEETNSKIIQIQCLLWYQLATRNQLEIPHRIFKFQLPIVTKLKTLVFGQQEQPL